VSRLPMAARSSGGRCGSRKTCSRTLLITWPRRIHEDHRQRLSVVGAHAFAGGRILTADDPFQVGDGWPGRDTAVRGAGRLRWKHPELDRSACSVLCLGADDPGAGVGLAIEGVAVGQGTEDGGVGGGGTFPFPADRVEGLPFIAGKGRGNQRYPSILSLATSSIIMSDRTPERHSLLHPHEVHGAPRAISLAISTAISIVRAARGERVQAPACERRFHPGLVADRRVRHHRRVVEPGQRHGAVREDAAAGALVPKPTHDQRQQP
jgi:hypothetical protein